MYTRHRQKGYRNQGGEDSREQTHPRWPSPKSKSCQTQSDEGGVSRAENVGGRLRNGRKRPYDAAIPAARRRRNDTPTRPAESPSSSRIGRQPWDTAPGRYFTALGYSIVIISSRDSLTDSLSASIARRSISLKSPSAPAISARTSNAC